VLRDDVRLCFVLPVTDKHFARKHVVHFLAKPSLRLQPLTCLFSPTLGFQCFVRSVFYDVPRLSFFALLHFFYTHEYVSSLEAPGPTLSAINPTCAHSVFVCFTYSALMGFLPRWRSLASETLSYIWSYSSGKSEACNYRPKC